MFRLEKDLYAAALRQRARDLVAKNAVKTFADKLAEAREQDAQKLLAAARGLESEAVDVRRKKAYDLMLDKLAEVGYKEAVEIFRKWRKQ